MNNQKDPDSSDFYEVAQEQKSVGRFMSTPLRMLGESHKLCFLNLEDDSNACIHHSAVDNRLDGAHDDHTKSKTISVITTNATRL